MIAVELSTTISPVLKCYWQCLQCFRGSGNARQVFVVLEPRNTSKFDQRSPVGLSVDLEILVVLLMLNSSYAWFRDAKLSPWLFLKARTDIRPIFENLLENLENFKFCWIT